MKDIKLFDIIILILSVYVLGVLVLSVAITFPTEIQKLLDYIDNCICVIFLFDFGYRYYKAENKLDYMKWGWIDLISSIPAIPVLRFGRVFRLIRLLRVLRAFRGIVNISRFLFRSRIKGTMLCTNIILILMSIFSSISILIVEKAPESNIKTAEDAIWWVFTTITTVGYGDKYPVTSEGRLIGALLMLVGVGLFGVYSGWMASFFLRENKNVPENDD